MYDDDDDAIDQSQENADDTSNASEEETDTGDGYREDPRADSADDAGDDSQPAPHEIEASRGALGAVLSKLQDNGVDIDALATRAGVDTTDVDDMEHEDLVALAQHVATTHPKVAQNVLGRFPVAQGLLGRFLGN
ncbi:MAG TPA: hypothetical protein VFW40_05230 [Capsulimonadaceae bacterium]|nr:hypothetical protein [Capsulimonadaceae bacterium]